MVHRLSRRPGPEHPALFESDADFPPEPIRPDPAAARALDDYRPLLDEAGVTSLATVSAYTAGREVVVAGCRHPAESGDDSAVAVLDDGTARVRLAVAHSASASVRDTLRARLLLLTARTSVSDDATILRVTAAHDLRQLGDDYRAAARRSRGARAPRTRRTA